MSEFLSLRWRTLKAWDLNEDGPAMAAIRRYHKAAPVSMSAAMQHDTAEQKSYLCDAIDALDSDTVHLDWDGVDVSKEKAKEYVMGSDR